MSTNPEKQRNNMIQNLQAKTGRSLQGWVDLVKVHGFTRHKQIITYLKSEHELTYGYANLIALEALHPTGESPLESQYSGSKAGLRPIYEQIARAVKAFGTDVELAPKKAYVSLRRNKQFGIIQPSTSTRVDVGINLQGVDPTERLEASGSFNGMVSHRVRVHQVSEVDEQLIGWLRQAYEAA